ncbi:MAG TPA: tryptophan synthase subunit alpha [Gemmatimonadales bacterium]|nr:tryptophan synthase subunit alpha [Gemmatimonadales bacterium]
MSEGALARAFRTLAGRRRAALVTYLTAGYPDRDTSLEAFRAADELADVLEVGVPFSDPLADGPTIQRSTFAALANGMTLGRTFELIDRARFTRPVVVFSYLNPILRYGTERFLRDAAALGVAGVLLTDVPAGSDPALEDALRESPLDLIRLVAPTTPAGRVREALAGARGFVYLVSRLGVTGASRSVAADLDESLARVRAASALPVAVGFGLSTPAQVAQVARQAEGVVVGSALVDRLGSEGVAGVRALLTSLRDALDATERPA